MKTIENTKYGKVYMDLIHLAQSNRSQKSFKETHHIIPRSLGGTDDRSNLVDLTPREHYIAHLLLFKHFKKTGDRTSMFKMALPIQLMRHGKATSISAFKAGAGYSHIFNSAKIAISEGMKGSGNPMYGKTNSRKGKKWSDTFSAASIANMRKAAALKRKHTEMYTWVNGSIEETCTLHKLADKYNISYRHLSDIVNPSTDRRVCKGWSIKGVDIRNKYVREQCSVIYEFYNLSHPLAIIGTIDDMMISYPELTYRGLRNIVNSYSSGTYIHKSYKGWMMKETYNKRNK